MDENKVLLFDYSIGYMYLPMLYASFIPGSYVSYPYNAQIICIQKFHLWSKCCYYLTFTSGGSGTSSGSGSGKYKGNGNTTNDCIGTGHGHSVLAVQNRENGR